MKHDNLLPGVKSFLPVDYNLADPAVRRPWTIYLINQTDITVHAIRSRRSGTNEPFTDWQVINPPVGRTCSYPGDDAGSQRCQDEGKYAPIGVVTCGTNWDVELSVRSPQGQEGISQHYDTETDCNYGGGIFRLV